MAIPKDNLNLAGEFRVASEILKRGVFATVTYGQKKRTDVYAIGGNLRAATIQVKASNSNKILTKLYQTYRDADGEHPDFWVLYSAKASGDTFDDRFFILTHEELARVQGERNCLGESLSYEECAARFPKGVDNVLISHVEDHEDAWDKIIQFCNS